MNSVTQHPQQTRTDERNDDDGRELVLLSLQEQVKEDEEIGFKGRKHRSKDRQTVLTAKMKNHDSEKWVKGKYTLLLWLQSIQTWVKRGHVNTTLHSTHLPTKQVNIRKRRRRQEIHTNLQTWQMCNYLFCKTCLSKTPSGDDHESPIRACSIMFGKKVLWVTDVFFFFASKKETWVTLRTV